MFGYWPGYTVWFTDGGRKDSIIYGLETVWAYMGNEHVTDKQLKNGVFMAFGVMQEIGR